MGAVLKGIGDTATEVNKIMPSLDASINRFVCGHTSGIIRSEFYEFAAQVTGRTVTVRGGLLQAYGYFGASDTEKQITFGTSSGTQYSHIYAEIDLTVAPNIFDIKATPLSSSSGYTYRQDNLGTTPSGKYQFPLWLATVTALSITLTDRRAFIDKPLNAVNAETSVTQPQTDNSTKIATTAFVKTAVTNAMAITEGNITISDGTVIGTVRRQGNFVICSGNGYNTTYGVSATIPVGFRPKTTVNVGVSATFMAMSLYPNNQISGGAAGQAYSDGRLIITLQPAVGEYLAVVHTAAAFYGGWEIT
jgi:hypothetical protein